jgi:polyisoprenoid-binding protein YceI
MTTTTLPILRDGTWTIRPDEATASFTVRKLGLIPVRGGFPVTGGSVTVTGGRPVSATATLDAAGVRTGIRKRDADLQGRRFFHTAEHPRIEVRSTRISPAGDGWTATAVLTVADGEVPLELQVDSRPDTASDTVRIRVSGVLDRAASPIRAPRWLIGRWVAIAVDATLDRPR